MFVLTMTSATSICLILADKRLGGQQTSIPRIVDKKTGGFDVKISIKNAVHQTGMHAQTAFFKVSQACGLSLNHRRHPLMLVFGFLPFEAPKVSKKNISWYSSFGRSAWTSGKVMLPGRSEAKRANEDESVRSCSMRHLLPASKSAASALL